MVEETKELAQFLYSLEPKKHDGSSKSHIVNLINVVCPALKEKYPDHTEDLSVCCLKIVFIII